MDNSLSESARFAVYREKLKGICEANNLSYVFIKNAYPIKLVIRPLGGVGEQMSMLEEATEDNYISPGASILFTVKDGNLTYRMKEEEVAQCRPFFDEQPREWVNMGVQADNLAGEYFITTGSGKFFRNVEPDPVHSIGIVEINDKGDSWRIVWGLEDGAKPTSEFPSHFMNHSVRKAATNGANRVIYHCHATNVIALTYILPLTDRDFTRALWQSATECPVVFPEGVGVCPWMVPGGADIAMATSELMKTYQAAIWAQHGLFASGPDFDITFGLAHTIEKSAEIYVKVLSMGGGLIRQTITDDDLRAIAHDFGVTLNENFLD